MAPVFTTTASLGSLAVEQGQEACFPLAEAAGCDGIEIRRELFGGMIPDMKEMKLRIAGHSLVCVYSAPVELWLPDGTLNVSMLDVIVPEALDLGALLVKTSLGHYRPGVSMLSDLEVYWKANVPADSGLQLTVENDQTPHGGSVSRLKKFFGDAWGSGFPVGMTFDIGNWFYSGEDNVEAAEALGGYVIYIHFKHVEKRDGGWATLALPEAADSRWRSVLALLPGNTPRTIEFPVEGRDVEKALHQYVGMIREA